MTFRALTIPFADPDAFEDAFADPDPREGPDGEFEDSAVECCPEHGKHQFTTCCGVTRCLWCKAVVA